MGFASWVVLGDEDVEMQVRRDLEPAAEGDVRFVAGALADIRRLLHSVSSGEQLSPDEIASTESRVEAASPGPWTAFIEADGGQAGSDVIRVSETTPEGGFWAAWRLGPAQIENVLLRGSLR